MKRIGILGGSFNPVHIGHMMLASYVCQWGGLDEVRLMLSPQNPLKNEGTLIPDHHRMDMLRIATIGCRRITPSDLELSMPRPSYTVDTLRRLRDREPHARFELIIGADNWLIFDRWRECETIIREFGVIVYPRPGYELSGNLPEGVRIIDAPTCSLSSSMIRKAIADGREINQFVPPGVESYIKTNNLYRN